VYHLELKLNVATGEVSRIFNLDEYKCVMVRHGKYITVYNKITNVFVTQGQKVNPGTPIGIAIQGDNSGGEFEFQINNIGNNNQKLNPESWLIRR
jgi:murein hydrolase activator